jgi:hypothetical protein
MWSTLAFALMGDGDRAAELFSLINPINHASTRAGIHRYKVEPYVACADVYSAAPHIGRGGWTWYTGSAGWMYRTGVEGILGINLRGDRLTINPCIPRAWTGFEVTYKHGASRYRIAVENPHGVSRGIVQASMDGQEISRTACEIKLVDDGRYRSTYSESTEFVEVGVALGLAPFGLPDFPRNAVTARTSAQRATALAGTMRISRNASAGRAINKPPATAATVPRPRPLMSICIVRLRGNPPE